jgi:hypothetical protein
MGSAQGGIDGEKKEGKKRSHKQQKKHEFNWTTPHSEEG